MHDKKVASNTYPALFDIGFLLSLRKRVKQHHARVVEAGFEAAGPAIPERGGDKTFGFDRHAPGGVMVEASARAA